MSNNICYSRTKSPSNDTITDIVDHLYPCGASSDSQAHFTCCAAGDWCMEGGICKGQNNLLPGSLDSDFKVGGCTDPGFNDPSCPKHCGDQYAPAIQYEKDTEQWSCCQSFPNYTSTCTEPPTDDLWRASSPDLLQKVGEIPPSATDGNYHPPLTTVASSGPSTIAPSSIISSIASSSVASSSSSSPSSSSASSAANSAAATTPSTSPSASSVSIQSGLNASAKAGIGVAVTLAILGLLAAGVFLFLRRRKLQQQRRDDATVRIGEKWDGSVSGSSYVAEMPPHGAMPYETMPYGFQGTPRVEAHGQQRFEACSQPVLEMGSGMQRAELPS